MKSNIYDFFDDIVCINLDISTERKKHAEHIFNELNIPARFFTAKKHPNGGMYGCFHSHIEILKEAYAKGLNNILVFEDDFLTTASYSEEKILSGIEFMKNNEWDIFYFGYSVLRDNFHGLSTIMSGKYSTPDVVQFSPFCTHALCYNRESMRVILETYEDHIGILHYDMYLSSYTNFKTFCILPMVFDQNFYFEHNNESDDCIEFLVRTAFPLIAFTKINYRMSVLRYWTNIFYYHHKQYWHIFFLCIILYFIKNSLIANNKRLLKKNNVNIK